MPKSWNLELKIEACAWQEKVITDLHQSMELSEFVRLYFLQSRPIVNISVDKCEVIRYPSLGKGGRR